MAAKAERAASGSGAFIVAIVLIAVIGAGAGFSLKFVLPPREAPVVEAAKAKETAAKATEAHQDAHVGASPKLEPEPTGGQLLPLDAIVVSLASPQGTRLRLESFVQFTESSKLDRTELLREIAQDLVLYLRTLKLAQIETASGIEYLREDLAELAQLRSKGHARGIVIKSLIVE